MEAGDMASTVIGNKQVVEEFDRILNTRDFKRLDEICTPDMHNHALAPGRPPGLAGTKEFLESGAGRSFQGDAWESLETIAEGDFVVQHGVRGGHWPGGPFLGFPTQPGDYRREVVFLYRLRDGRICDRWAVRDDLTMLRQLQAI
jgi:predicted ester cyclase